MKKYSIVIEEHIVQSFEVVAESEAEARRIAEQKYRDEEFVLMPETVAYRLMAVENLSGRDVKWLEF